MKKKLQVMNKFVGTLFQAGSGFRPDQQPVLRIRIKTMRMRIQEKILMRIWMRIRMRIHVLTELWRAK